MKVAVIGATGLVGRTILEVLQQKNFPITELIPVASNKSIGKSVVFNESQFPVVSVETALKKCPNVALFSAGSNTSIELAPKFAALGCYVIDNSSAFRMQNNIKLIVPEVNGSILNKEDFLISNPNCSTIQLVMVLNPLHRRFNIKRVIISTYQAVTGSGQKGVDDLMRQRMGKNETLFYPYSIDLNVIPHIDSFLENGYTKEEMKISQETCKIMGDDGIKVSATAVRVPVLGGHSESVNIEFNNEFELSDVRELLSNTDGVIVIDNPKLNGYPMPIEAQGKDNVFVGRIRRDFSNSNTLNCWIVADNLRKGAATNAVQIAKLLVQKGWIS